MRKLHHEISKSIEVAARFGFISQDIFKNHITSTKRSMSFVIWSVLFVFLNLACNF